MYSPYDSNIVYLLDNWPSIHMLVGFENNFASWLLF